MSDTAPEPVPADESATPFEESWVSRHPMAAYSLGRLVLFAVPFAILYFVADFFTALLVAFLVSGMASYLNGVTIPVDGGASASHGWTRAPGSRKWVLHHA